MFQGIFKSAINDANKNYIFGTGSIPIQIKTAQLATFADGTTKQQGYEVAEVNKLISTMLTGWDKDGNKPKSMSDNYLELILSCDNGFVVKKRLQFPHIIAWQNDNTPYNIADVYKEFSVDNWLKADDFENPDITLVVEPIDEILTTSTATPPEATTEQSGRFYLYYRNLPVGINRVHIDFHIKTKTEPIDFDLEVIDGLSWKDAQTILTSNEQAKINVLLGGVKDVYNFTGAEGNFEDITLYEWSALYQQIISLNPNNKFTHDLYFVLYENSEIAELENKANKNEARLDVDEGVIFGTRPIFGELKGDGLAHFLSLKGLGFTSGTLYLKVVNPAANFVQYGVASSKDGKTLYTYLRVTWDNEAIGLGYVTINDSFSHIAITTYVKAGTNVYFFGNASDSLQQQIKNLKPKVFAHNAIVSFIDDDCGKYVPTIWGEIISASPIKMGFACIAGFMSGIKAPEVYEPMQLSELRALYEQGHEVYSHTWTHPPLYEDAVTLDELDFQCWKSRDWLYANGLGRNANIIVYSGGLGEIMTDKQSVVRRHYKYGVDTIGGGINPEPLKNKMSIYRFNADTATLAELKAKVDEAVNKKALLVFMNHAYELNKDKTAQVQKMIDIINYIKGTNATILPLEQALNQIYGM